MNISKLHMDIRSPNGTPSQPQCKRERIRKRLQFSETIFSLQLESLQAVERRTTRNLHRTPQLCDLINFDWIPAVKITHPPWLSQITSSQIRERAIEIPRQKAAPSKHTRSKPDSEIPAVYDAPRAGANDESNWRNQ